MSANSERSSSPADEQRLMQACEWVLRLQGPEVDEATTEQWLEWCQLDKQNFHAFESIRALWNVFDDRRLSASLISRQSDFDPSVAEVTSAASDSEGGSGRKMLWALAASLLLAVSGAIAYLGIRGNAVPQAQTLSTAVASLSRQTLPDGSTVELGARSAVRVELSKQSRSVRLDDGEAYFQVAKDPDRPFIVQAGELKVIAIGTAFNVRKAQDRIVVTVREGLVRIEPDEAAPVLARRENLDGEVRAGAGQQVTYSTQQRSLTLTKVDFGAPAADKAMAWQVGRLQFANEPLSSVIADINRYAPRPIVIADERLGQLTFTGTVRNDAIDDWLRGLEDVFPIEVVNRDEQGVLLVHRPLIPPGAP